MFRGVNQIQIKRHQTTARHAHDTTDTHPSMFFVFFFKGNKTTERWQLLFNLPDRCRSLKATETKEKFVFGWHRKRVGQHRQNRTYWHFEQIELVRSFLTKSHRTLCHSIALKTTYKISFDTNMIWQSVRPWNPRNILRASSDGPLLSFYFSRSLHRIISESKDFW